MPCTMLVVSGNITINEVPALMELIFKLGKQACFLSV